MFKDPRISPTGYFREGILRQHLGLEAHRHAKLPAGVIQGLCTVLPQEARIVDLGAGIGHYVKELRARGYNIVGLDGCPEISELTGGLVQCQDLTEPSCAHWHRAFQWAIFFEVGEHVPQEFEAVLLNNVARIPTEGLIVSWHTEKGGRMSSESHANPRSTTWVAAEFGWRGWRVDEERQERFRLHLGRRRFQQRAMVLRRA